ncbi:MAG: undecaprenyl-diphosphate phosphatase [Synergistaceae bacterium]|jgi:undecaprenyl-diphosphatase|nr:undecaprenyl-diphosphate phosphatase [Synergistaceae bacterium]
MDFTWQGAWRTLVLGVVQGVTEFLPVSSSGHLALLQTFFESPADPTQNLLAFDLFLHCATALAVLIFFRKDVMAILAQWFGGFLSKKHRDAEGWRYGWLILAGTAVTASVALPLEKAVAAAMSSYLAVGAGLLVTAGLLCVVPLAPGGEREVSLKSILLVGLAQGLAVFPGVSRSGATIVAALFLGLSASEAFRLSFLMSIPAILGASLLEGLKILRDPLWALPEGWVLAVLAAFALGCLSLAFLRRLVLSGRWAYFGIYCFLLGVAAIVSAITANF